MQTRLECRATMQPTFSVGDDVWFHGQISGIDQVADVRGSLRGGVSLAPIALFRVVEAQLGNFEIFASGAVNHAVFIVDAA